MSKLSCKCGGTIYDQTDQLPYKGKILRDQHASLLDNIASDIASYLAARLSGDEAKWLTTRFGPDYAELKLDDSSIIYDLMASLFAPGTALDVYQCERCQRLLVENRHRMNTFESFTPDNKETMELLRVRG